MKRVVVGITGASGAIYAKRVVELLTEAGVHVHVAASGLGRRLLHDELGMESFDANALSGGRGHLVTLYPSNDMGATIASGSFLHDGMIVVPCSSNTMAAISSGVTSTLVHRVASVTLKERRRLVIAHRETPLSHIDILNMQRLSEAGAVIVPLAPGFYMMPKTISDLVDFMAGRLLDLIGVPHTLNTRWDPQALKDSPEGD
ncbi:UbiX family flavin prenyltransferase [Cystobacter fuscus]|uniref:UbiX family flavin prenyltransferase n=1 Tax=Cystobacter fuscus TaxID=43 RepID=UPI002B2AD3AD|nr:UbiX family flavin prenyltransferase [Cystobacter fuscus]